MSKYTAEQARSSLQKMHGHPLTVAERAELFSMASNYADLLRERESAKATGLDYAPGNLDRTAPEKIWLQVNAEGDNSARDEPWPGADVVTWQDESIGGLEIQYVRADLVAPMLASARVPVEKENLDPVKLRRQGRVATEWEQGFNDGWNECRDAMLAAATKPEGADAAMREESK